MLTWKRSYEKWKRISRRFLCANASRPMPACPAARMRCSTPCPRRSATTASTSGDTPSGNTRGVYVDEALTGTKEDRDGFQRLLADCRAGKIDIVLTKSISRFARNTVTLLETVRELKALGVDVYFEEQNIHSLKAATAS